MMTSKYSGLLLLVLCLGLTCVPAKVSAQAGGGKVLVSAGAAQLRQSDVDTVVEFYEWAIDVKFTNAQRAKFQSVTEADFRNDPATARKGIDDLLGMRAQVKAMDEGRRREVREKFITGFIKGLRQHTDDEASKLLLTIYDASRGGGSNEPDVAAGDDGAGSAGNVAALAGKWVWSRTGGTTWNPNGTYAGGNGSRFTYQFSAGGAVEYTGIMNVMMGGCSQQVFLSKKGRARLSGDTLTIEWSQATSTRDFSCDRANNYTKTLPAETETLKVAFKNSSTGQRQLCTVSGGGETCFSPAE